MTANMEKRRGQYRLPRLTARRSARGTTRRHFRGPSPIPQWPARKLARAKKTCSRVAPTLGAALEDRAGLTLQLPHPVPPRPVRATHAGQAGYLPEHNSRATRFAVLPKENGCWRRSTARVAASGWSPHQPCPVARARRRLAVCRLRRGVAAVGVPGRPGVLRHGRVVHPGAVERGLIKSSVGWPRIRIKSIRVENFRTVRSATLDLNGLTAIAGAGGAGKSTFRCAFPAFQGEQMLNADFYGSGTAGDVLIASTFTGQSGAAGKRLSGCPRSGPRGRAAPRAARPGRMSRRPNPSRLPRHGAACAAGESAPACSSPPSCDGLPSPAPGGGPRSARGRPGGSRK